MEVLVDGQCNKVWHLHRDFFFGRELLSAFYPEEKEIFFAFSDRKASYRSSLLGICMEKVSSVILAGKKDSLGHTAVLPIELTELLLEIIAREDDTFITPLLGWLSLTAKEPRTKNETRSGNKNESDFREEEEWKVVTKKSKEDSYRLRKLANKVIQRVKRSKAAETISWSEKRVRWNKQEREKEERAYEDGLLPTEEDPAESIEKKFFYYI